MGRGGGGGGKVGASFGSEDARSHQTRSLNKLLPIPEGCFFFFLFYRKITILNLLAVVKVVLQVAVMAVGGGGGLETSNTGESHHPATRPPALRHAVKLLAK